MLEFLLVFFVDFSMKIATNMFTLISRLLMKHPTFISYCSSLTQTRNLLLDASDFIPD